MEKTDENINFVFDMFINAIYLHDIGKSNPGFQYSAMKNKYFEKIIVKENILCYLLQFLLIHIFKS